MSLGRFSTHRPTAGLVGDQRAQAAIESALVTPLSLFVILGMLQMGLVQQARFLTDYAAYRGARAASTARALCDEIKTAELAALVPTLGRADDLKHWQDTWNGVNDPKTQVSKTQRIGSLPILHTNNKVDNHDPSRSFDDYTPGVAPDAAVEKVRVELYYYYEMKVPFVNWLITRYLLAQMVASDRAQWLADQDALHPIGKGTTPQPIAAAASTTAQIDTNVIKNYMNLGVYVVPIYASWTMRMFSQTDKDQQQCPVP